MRFDCPSCHGKAIATSSTVLSSEVKEGYYTCTNTKECGCTFVVTMGLKHYLNPPIKSTHQLAMALIKSLPINERQALQRDMFG